MNTNNFTVHAFSCRHVCHKWHYKIAKALVVCLESKDFVQIRNSLIVMTKIIQHFPVIQNLATVIEKRVEKVNVFMNLYFIFKVKKFYLIISTCQVCEDEKDKRQDLYIKARSYQGQLVARKSRMIKEGDFHVVRRIYYHACQQTCKLTFLLQVKGKKEDEGEVAGSPAKTEKDKSGDTVEEGEIRSSSKEKRRDR